MSDSVSAPPTEALNDVSLEKLDALAARIETLLGANYKHTDSFAIAYGLRRCIAELRQVRGELAAAHKLAVQQRQMSDDVTPY